MGLATVIFRGEQIPPHLFYLVPSRTITYYSARTVRYFCGANFQTNTMVRSPDLLGNLALQLVLLLLGRNAADHLK